MSRGDDELGTRTQCPLCKPPKYKSHGRCRGSDTYTRHSHSIEKLSIASSSDLDVTKTCDTARTARGLAQAPDPHGLGDRPTSIVNSKLPVRAP